VLDGLWKSFAFSAISRKRPCPRHPRGRGLSAEEETASALLPRSFAFLKKEMKFLLTERLRSSSSSAGKNGKAPRSVFLAKQYRLAWKLRRRFRPLASDYTIFCSPQGKKSSRKHNHPSQTKSTAFSGGGWLYLPHYSTLKPVRYRRIMS
jgi:hypothetical protein